MPAKPGGPEDLLAVELAYALAGKPLPHEEWKKKVRSIPPGRKGKTPERNGTSVNWWWRAMAVAALRGQYNVVREMLRLYFGESNDLDCSECYVALGMYFADNLTAKTALRDELAKIGDRDLAEKLTVEIRQVHAALLILSSDPDNLAANWVSMAGPRGGSGSEGDGKPHRGIFEYLVLRSAGWSDKEIEKRVPDGRAMVKNISGNDPQRAMKWIRHHVEQLERSMQDDAEHCWAAYRQGGKPALVQFLKVGTRAPFRWIVAEGGVLSIMGRNPNSFKGPLVVAGKDRGQDPFRFPVGAKKVGYVAGTAEIDEDLGIVRASVEGVGWFTAGIPKGRRIVDVTHGPSGVRNLLAGDEPPAEEPPIVVDDPPDPNDETQDETPPPERSRWQRFLDRHPWLRRIFG